MSYTDYLLETINDDVAKELATAGPEDMDAVRARIVEKYEGKLRNNIADLARRLKDLEERDDQDEIVGAVADACKGLISRKLGQHLDVLEMFKEKAEENE